MDANVWLWRITTIYSDGTSRTDDYEDNFGGKPITSFARHISRQPGVDRIELATTFVAGEQINPGSAV